MKEDVVFYTIMFSSSILFPKLTLIFNIYIYIYLNFISTIYDY